MLCISEEPNIASEQVVHVDLYAYIHFHHYIELLHPLFQDNKLNKLTSTLQPAISTISARIVGK